MGGGSGTREWVWTEAMVHPGARAGHEGPATKCFEKEHMMLFHCNDFCLAPANSVPPGTRKTQEHSGTILDSKKRGLWKQCKSR